MSSTPIRVPTDARWDCHSCGACCRLYELGPVDPHIIEGLHERRIEDAWAPAREAPWYTTRTGPNGETAYFLTHRDGHCVFLRADNLCAVHGLFGAEAKPSFCREYPFHFVEDPKGLVAVVRASCAGWSASNADGRPLADQAAAMAALPRVVPLRRFSPEQVAVLPDLHVPLETWLAWEERLLAVADAEYATPEALLRALRDTLATLTGRSFSEPHPERARLATGAVIEALRRVMHKVVQESRPDEEPQRVEFARSITADLETALPALRNAETPFHADALRHQLVLARTFLLARGWQALGSVAEGLGAFTVQIAVIRALASEPDGIAAASAGRVLVRWTKLIENRAIVGVLKIVRPALLDAFLFR